MWVRFPLERRLPPSLRVLRAIAPDLREAAMVAEAFGLPELTPELRGASQAKMARRLRAEWVPREPVAKRVALALMGRPWVVGAVRACSRAAEMMAEAGMAQRRYVVVGGPSRGGRRLAGRPSRGGRGPCERDHWPARLPPRASRR